MDAAIHVRDIVLAGGVQMLTDGDIVVVNVRTASVAEPEAEAEAVEAEPAATAEEAAT